MTARTPSKDALQRLAETSARYRDAFLEVQAVLASLDLGRVPSWTFAIDRLPLEEVAELSPALAEAEERRRAWRTCLHALTELIALDDPDAPGEIAGEPTEASGDAEHLGKLDRFITIVNFAKAGGCIYVDGGFQPVARPGTKEAAPAPRPEPNAMPEGAHIELPSPRELVGE